MTYDKSTIVFEPLPQHPRFLNLIGQQFSRLTVLGFAGASRWWCQCICGEITQVQRSRLRNATTKSCGCLQKEKVGMINRSHGLSRHPLYNAWGGMISRCENSNHSRYKDYGQRGIRICQRWHSFAFFLEDMGEKPLSKLSIERLDVNGHYSCGNCSECLDHKWEPNCKWGTPIEQANNCRNVPVFTYQNETLSLAQWARKLGLVCGSLRSRLRKNWSIEKTLSTPIRNHKPYKHK